MPLISKILIAIAVAVASLISLSFMFMTYMAISAGPKANEVCAQATPGSQVESFLAWSRVHVERPASFNPQSNEYIFVFFGATPDTTRVCHVKVRDGLIVSRRVN